MSSSSGEEEWDKDTDEINSLDSEELHETRPNRWQGQPDTWKLYTEQDRSIFASLQNTQNQDLSLHLYNAFALKQKRRRDENAPDPEKDVDKETGEAVADHSSWKVPKRWTAWPVRSYEVPSADLVQRTLDGGKIYTTRHPEPTGPSRLLEEDISATILRLAKERFRGRSLANPEDADDAEEEGDESEQESLGAKSAASDRDSVGVDTDVVLKTGSSDEDSGRDAWKGARHDREESDKDASSPGRRRRATRPDFEPTIATDDELSYRILRPTARRIREQVDNTLRVLHNARVAAVVTGAEDTGNESASDSVRSRSVSRSVRRRSRITPAPDPELQSEEEQESQNEGDKTGRKRGRPRQPLVSLEGETAEEQMLRDARERKAKVPAFERAADEHGRGKRARRNSSSSRSRSRSSAFRDQPPETLSDEDQTESTPRKEKRVRGHARKFSSAHSSSKSRSRSRFSDSGSERSVSTSASGNYRRPISTRYGIRDWRDVVGAAALAGFPPNVIARTAQRCATLFGQSMDIMRMEEVHLGSAATAPENPVHAESTTRYEPGDLNNPPQCYLEDEECQDDPTKHRVQRRSVSRGRSLSRRRLPSLSSENEDDKGTPSQNRQRVTTTPTARRASSRPASRLSAASRGRSGTPGTQHFCPHPQCPRAVEGFSRHTNLTRHLQTMHKAKAAPLLVDEVDSEDELDGGAHVDRFLRPIKIRRGWRGVDQETRTPARGRRRFREVGARAGSETSGQHSAPTDRMEIDSD